MKEEYYHLTYWGRDEDNPTVSQLYVKLVLVPTETMMALKTPNIRRPQAYLFIIGDGQEFLIGAEYFHSLERVYGQSFK